LVVLAAGSVALALGAQHYQSGWPGAGGHHWIDQGIPGRMASFSWALTLSVSAYWAHPGSLAAFPPGKLAWMAASPPVALLTLAALVSFVRRAELQAHWRSLPRAPSC
jgi:hypothetical protein